MKKISIYICAVLLFILIESVWLKIMNKNFYQVEIGQLMKPDTNLIAVLILLMIYITALCYLVIYPLQHDTNLNFFNIFVMGGLLGLAAYATYALTSLAILNGFSVKVAVVDTIWGGVLTATVAVVTTWVAARLNWLA